MITIRHTAEKTFLSEFKRVHYETARVRVNAGQKVVVVDDEPRVEVVDTKADSVTFGMIMLITLQEACDRGLATYEKV